MIRIDLHTHSEASPDGGLSIGQYKKMFDRGELDMVAITDHNTIAFAAHAQQQLGKRIIVGEEIMTTQGEIIGLFLTRVIAPYQSPQATIAAIQAQGGVVYIPHPFETRRKGLSEENLEAIAADVGIIEVYNGRAMQKSCRERAVRWAKEHAVAIAASSDAHGTRGWGRTYTVLQASLMPGVVAPQFQNAQLIQRDVGIIGRMYPTVHRARRKFHKHA